MIRGSSSRARLASALALFTAFLSSACAISRSTSAFCRLTSSPAFAGSLYPSASLIFFSSSAGPIAQTDRTRMEAPSGFTKMNCGAEACDDWM